MHGLIPHSLQLQFQPLKIYLQNFNPLVALRFTSTTDFLGLTLPLEIMTTSKRNMVLGVKGLSLDMIPEETLKSALVKHFSRHTGYKAECEIISGVAYLTFEHPEGMCGLMNFIFNATYQYAHLMNSA